MGDCNAYKPPSATKTIFARKAMERQFLYNQKMSENLGRDMILPVHDSGSSFCTLLEEWPTSTRNPTGGALLVPPRFGLPKVTNAQIIMGFPVVRFKNNTNKGTLQKSTNPSIAAHDESHPKGVGRLPLDWGSPRSPTSSERKRVPSPHLSAYLRDCTILKRYSDNPLRTAKS